MKKKLVAMMMLLAAKTVFALTWTTIDPSALPYEQRGVRPAVLNGYFYVATATGSFSGANPLNIYRSSDGLTWTLAKDFSATGYIIDQIVHGSFLYIFVWSNNTLRGTTFRTSDGVTWDTVDTNATYAGASPRVSFGGYLYEFTNTFVGSRKTDGTGSSLAWAPVPQGPNVIAPNRGYNVAVFQGQIFAETYDPAAITAPYTLRVYRSSDGMDWTQSMTETGYASYRLVATDSGLYRGFENVYRLTAATGTWTLEIAGDWTYPTFPMNVFGYAFAHKLGLPETTYLRSSTGGWVTAGSCLGVGWTGYGVTAAWSADLAYVPICTSPRVLKWGLTALAAKTFILPTLTFDQSNATLSAMTLSMNLDETLTSFVVQNLGTARANTDIERLQLVRSRIVNSQEVFTTIATLTADSDGKTWRLPPGTTLPIEDQDNLYVTGDIASFPTSQSTVQLGVTSMGWLRNVSYSPLLPLVTSQAIAINGNPSAPVAIDGFLPYPQPASNEVRFMYDLSDISDVKIRVFNVSGNLVAEITDPGKAAALRSSTIWNTTDVAPGAYFATVEIVPQNGDKKKFKKPVFIKR